MTLSNVFSLLDMKSFKTLVVWIESGRPSSLRSALVNATRRYCTDKVNARRRIRALEDELRISVEVENYERAARLRDEISDLKKGMEAS